GNRLVFEGSLNETAGGWQRNSESIRVYASWGPLSPTERECLDEICDGFEKLWENQHRDFEVLTLPEAIREGMIKIARENPISEFNAVLNPERNDEPAGYSGEISSQSTTAWKEELKNPDLSELRELLEAGSSAEHPYIGTTLLPLDLWPHQKLAVWRLVEEYPKGFMLCDEVGLGKTIEAGGAARALWVQGKVKRILICAPASLCEQWQREMAYKFQMPFQLYRERRHWEILPEEQVRKDLKTFEPDLLIVSHGILRHSGRRRELAEMDPFDLVIVDEAHYLRRSNPDPQTVPATEVKPEYGQLYRAVEEFLVRRKKAKALWLATATPVQLNFVEAWDLFRLLRRTGSFDADVELSASWYRWIERLQQGESLEKEWPLIVELTDELTRIDPEYFRWLQEAFLKNLRLRWRYLGQGGSGKWQDRILRNSRLCSELVQLLFYLAPLSRVMIRHSRGLLEVYRKEGLLEAGLARREIVAQPPIVRTPEEMEIEKALQNYCAGLEKRIRQSQEGESRRLRTTLGFYLSFLRLRAASSLKALDNSLQNRMGKVEATLAKELREMEDESEDEVDTGFGEDDLSHTAFLNDRSVDDLRWEARQIERLREQIEPLIRREKDSKQETLLGLLEERRKSDGSFQQTVIFTRFLDTLWDLWERLARLRLRIGVFCGKGGFILEDGVRKKIERSKIRDLFVAKKINLLLCTDAAAEGLNLQVADLLINLDMPWGPMKLEQRIGRIDRIGQEHEVVRIVNLFYEGSVEEIVYDRLRKRFQAAVTTVGHYSFSLLPLDEEDFRRLDRGDVSEEELETEAKGRLEQQRRLIELRTFGPEEVAKIHRRLKGANPIEREKWTARKAERVVERVKGVFEQVDENWRIGSHLFGFGGEEGVSALVPKTPVWEVLCKLGNVQSEREYEPVEFRETLSMSEADLFRNEVAEAAEVLLGLYRRQHREDDNRQLFSKMERHLDEGREINLRGAPDRFRVFRAPHGYILLSYLKRNR
ncbi:MAG TPA: helicase-related protein, partial [Opitutales bacterium]|nr:helicase-related protein [Opitutales bacterium]